MGSIPPRDNHFFFLTRISRLLVPVIVAQILVTAGMMIAYNFYPNFLFWENTSVVDDVGTLGMYFFIINTGLGLAIWIIFLYWFYMAYKNLKVLYVGPLRHSPLGALVCLFIPILNLWQTYYNVKEIWKYSDRNTLPSGEPIKYISEQNIVRIWWISILLSIGFLFFDRISTSTISDSLYILALYMWILIVRKVTFWQNEKYKALSSPQN
jgi:hypothetical protein